MNARASQQPPDPGIAPTEPGDTAAATSGGAASATPDPLQAIASDHDAAGIPVHRGWAPIGSHHRWMEPFVMVLLSVGPAHGYAIVGELAELGITNGSVDLGQVYRTLRDLEGAGQVRSTWSTTGSGPARRDYELTAAGYAALDEWAAVIKERARLIGEFDARYLESLSTRRTT
ncbi:MAG: PadR family transcriptional regulator [Candidatus Limnocylindrales bacterium]